MAEAAAVSPAPGAAGATIVVGFDRTPASLMALRKAAELGRRLEALIVVVHAVDLADYPVDPDAGDWEAQAEEVMATEQETVGEVLRGYQPGWYFRSFRAPAADALIRLADETDAVMIVVGVREHGLSRLLDHLLRAPVSQRLVKRSARPVLLVSEHGG